LRPAGVLPDAFVKDQSCIHSVGFWRNWIRFGTGIAREKGSFGFRPTQRSGLASVRTDSWLDPCPAACGPCVHSDESRLRRTQCPPSDRQAPAVFLDDCLQCLAVKTQVGHQMLQSSILIFHLPQSLCYAYVQPAILRLPVVNVGSLIPCPGKDPPSLLLPRAASGSR